MTRLTGLIQYICMHRSLVSQQSVLEQPDVAQLHCTTLLQTLSTQNQALLCRVAADEVHSAAVWEMFYCMAAYDGLMDAQICVGVCDGTLRPHFNESCPLPYQKLAMQCWAQNPEDRHAYLLLAATASAHV